MENKNKKTTVLAIVFLVIVLLVLGGIAVLSTLLERVTPNPPGTVGNTAGNLNNGGYFCEYNGMVYFANAYDLNNLYIMDPDEGQLRKLSNTAVRNILAGGHYLYYFHLASKGEAGNGNVRVPRSFNRCNLQGKDITSLTRDTVVTGQLVDNRLYLLTAGNQHPVLYKMNTDKSDRVDLANYNISPACVSNGTIYYSGTQDNHYLYSLNTTTDQSSVVWEGNLCYPIVEGDYVYYMDMGNNYRICRYSMSQEVVEVLTNDRADCFNVGSGYVYYQKNGRDPQLICMRTDGSDKKVVAVGNFTHINMTSRYAYFQDFEDETTLYHTYLGSDYAEVFYGAQAMGQKDTK